MAPDCMIFPDKNISQLIQLFRDENLNNNQAGDATWILTSAFLIFTMQSGFGLLEAGETTTFVFKKYLLIYRAHHCHISDIKVLIFSIYSTLK